jgi:nitrate/nitrite transporter NarK
LIGVGLLLGVAGASFAVGVPFVAGWYERAALAFERRRAAGDLDT